MEVKTLAPDMLFRVFTSVPEDPVTLVLDVRPQKDFVKRHILQSFCVRLSANGKALVDYSKNTYQFRWSQDCWWGKFVVVYGNAGLKKDHPVVEFLAKENKCKKLAIYKEGIDAFEKAYPFLITPSVKANAGKRYPGEIIPGVLYLGDWELAKAHDRLDEINVKRIVTIHNNPENLQPPSRFKQLKFTLADVDTDNITPFFALAFDFIEDAREAKEAVLVHCGAGVSRSAALCIAYLMRKMSWTAEKARAHCKLRRSVINPNDGFWRSLCAFEGVLGLSSRSNPAATSGFHGSDAPVLIDEGAAGQKVTATFKTAAELRKEERAQSNNAASTSGAADGRSGGNGVTRREEDSLRDARKREEGDRDTGRGERRERDRSRDRHAGRSGERERSLDRGNGRDGRRDGSGERDRGRPHRSRSRDRKRHRTPHAEPDSHPRKDRRDHAGGVLHGREERGVVETAAGRRREPLAAANGNHGELEGQDDRQQLQGSAGLRTPPAGSLQQVPSAKDALKAGASDPPPVTGAAAGVVVLDVLRDGKEFLGRLQVDGLTRRNACIFGRHPQCDVHLEHNSISRQHAKLMLDSVGGLVIADMGSAHNTMVDGTWIRPDTPRSLKMGAEFKFGASSRYYKVAQVPLTDAAAKRKLTEPPAVQLPDKRVKREH